MVGNRDMEYWIGTLLRWGVLVSAFLIILGWSLGEFSTLVAAGILLLIWLPIIRVAMTCVLFFSNRDFLFVALSLGVFLILIGGIVFGLTLA